VKATGTIIEIGNNDLSKCETLGDVMDMLQGKIDGEWKPNLLVGGNTKSKKLVLKELSGCYAKSFAFF
jgi:hypothetical protein